MCNASGSLLVTIRTEMFLSKTVDRSKKLLSISIHIASFANFEPILLAISKPVTGLSNDLIPPSGNVTSTVIIS